MTPNRARVLVLAGHIAIAVVRFDIVARVLAISELAFTGKTAHTSGKVTNKLELNPIGFVISFIMMMILAEILPSIAVGTMALVVLYEVMTHPENWNKLSEVVKKGTK